MDKVKNDDSAARSSTDFLLASSFYEVIMYELLIVHDANVIAYYHDKRLAEQVCYDLKKRFPDLDLVVNYNPEMLVNAPFQKVLNKVEEKLK